jgi:hypothetical protein
MAETPEGDRTDHQVALSIDENDLNDRGLNSGVFTIGHLTTSVANTRQRAGIRGGGANFLCRIIYNSSEVPR